MTTYRLFAGLTGPSSTASDTEHYTMGTVFRVSAASFADAVPFWRPAVSAGDTVTVGIFESNGPNGATGTLLGSKSGVVVPANYGDWFTAALDSPVPLEPGKEYISAVFFTAPNFYPATGGYWAPGGPGDGGRTVGILTAPSQTQAYNTQNAFHAGGSSITFPESGFNGGFYWIDVRVSDSSTPPANTPPVANAGSAQTVTVGTQVTLSGAASTDSDGTIANYAWSQTSGPTVTLSGSGATRTFTPSTAGTYVFSLTVTDNGGATSSATVQVSANAPGNNNPVANAGVDQTKVVNETVALVGSGSDSDGTVVSYAWVQSSGPSVTLAGTGASRTFTPTQPGTYSFTLTVTDDDGATASDSVSVVVGVAPEDDYTLWVKDPEGVWHAIGGSSSSGGDEPHVFRPESYGAVGDGVTDDTAALQACINAAVAAAPDHNYSVEVRLSAKEYAVRGPVSMVDFSYGQLHIPFVSASENKPKVTLAIRGPVPAQPLLYWDQEQSASAGAVLKSTLATNPNDGGGAVLAGMLNVTGVPTPDDITTFSHMFVVLENFQVQLPHNRRLGGICLKRVAQAKVDGVAVHSDRYRNSTPSIVANITEPDNYGLWMPEQGNNAWNEIGSFSAMGLYTGIIAQEHISAQNLAFVYGQIGLKVTGSGSGQTWADGEQKQIVHASWVGMLLNEAVNYWVHNASAPMQLVVSELGGEGVTRFDAHIYDPNNLLTGEAHFHDIYNEDPVVEGGGRFKVINDNRGPGAVAVGMTPALPSSGTSFQNPFWRDANVYFDGGSATVSVDGVSLGAQTAVRVPSGSSISVTYSGSPTWSWILD